MRKRLILQLVVLLPVSLVLGVGWLVSEPKSVVMAFGSDKAHTPAPPETGTRTAPKGRMILGTRGFARVVADDRNTNKEAQTLFRIEFPYGAASGWKLTYQGYSDGTADDVSIIAVGVWFQQATGKPLSRQRITFRKSNTVVIAPGELQESDGIAAALLPGARVWVTTWYKAGSTATGLPYQSFLYTKELAGAGTESQDGTLAGAIGSLTDHTLTGGFDHRELGGPLSAGLAYLCRGYQPMCATGQPHPSYVGTEVVPLFIGDSINVMNDNFNNDNREWTFRSFSGRFCKDVYPFLVFGQSGSGSSGFLSLVGTPLFKYLFGSPSGAGRICTHCVNEYGINEIRNSGDAAGTWKNRAEVATVCKKYGVPYLHCTLTPCGADNLTGPARNKGYAAFVAQRKIFNDCVRAESDDAHLPGCVGFIDPCRKLEVDPKNSNNVWAADTGGDLHPNSVGHQHYADTIPAALFANAPNPVPEGAAPRNILVKAGARIAFLGDSITDQGWKHPAGYVKLIVNGLEAQKIRVTPIPAGVGGNIAREMRERLQKDVLDKKPDWLLLSCGINDVWLLQQHKQDFEKYKQQITELVEIALEAKVQVVILTTTVIGEDLNEEHNRTLVRYNEFLRGLAKEKRCLLADVDVDFREALKSPTRTPGMLTADGVHLNPHGDQMMASRVLRTLGFTEDQLKELQESWRDIPDAWQLRANYDKGMGRMFLVQKLLTIRQYEQLQQIAARKKWSAHQLVNDLHRENFMSFIKPQGSFESFEAIFEQKRQEELQPKLQAKFDKQIDELLAPK